jgi:soluble lytic murein transglycosylase-like protein
MIVLVLFAVAIAAPAGAEMFRYTDENGNVAFTDQAHVAEAAARRNPAPVAETAPTARKVVYTGVRREDFQEYVYEASTRYRLDPELVNALILVESNFDELALSDQGAMGLMQLMPDTADQLGVESPFNPRQNIEGGVKYLRYLIERFRGDVELALAAYNAGPTTVTRYGGVPPYGETRRYVRAILANYSGRRHIAVDNSEPSIVRRVVLPDGTVYYTTNTASSR